MPDLAHKALRRVRGASRRLIGANPPGRSLNPRANDIFLVSYPRSGNTWVRFLIGNLMHDTATTFANIETRVPDIYVSSQSRMACMSGPRVIKSHEPYRPEYPTTIYLVREPRDVAISYYQYMRKVRRERAPDWPIYLTKFLSSGFAFGTWGDHVRSWCDAGIQDSDFLLVSYEELVNDPVPVMYRIARFIGFGEPGGGREHAPSRVHRSKTCRRKKCVQVVSGGHCETAIPIYVSFGRPEWVVGASA